MPKHHFAKKQSKRMTTRKRAKIEKKVREHNRKIKKDGKKGKNQFKKKKEPGVPNSYPFKEQLLKEAELKKQRAEEERAKQKEKRKKNRQATVDKHRNLQSLVKDAQQRSSDYNKKNVSTVNGEKKLGETYSENSLKAYYKEFRKVIEASDVIIQVLDARDPLGSRCKQVEETVLAAGPSKRVLLLLNKIDLVPKENVEKWLKYLRNEFPTVAFKASTQEQNEHLSQSKVSLEKASDTLRQSSKCLGADTLMKLLANYCRNKDIKTSITVGVVGFPNTGKSSIINSLKRNRACNVGATPGVTKSMQAVQLDKNIKLLDSPGIVIPMGSTDSQVILRNCVKVESIVDPVPPVEAILRRSNKQKIMLKYNVPDFGDVNEFLALLAKRMGKLKKGGIPDMLKAAKKVLQDWNSGKLRYYTEPPESQSTHVTSQIVAEMSKEFDIDAVLAEDSHILQDLSNQMLTDMVVESSGEMSGHVITEPRDECDEDEMLDDDAEMKDEFDNIVVTGKEGVKKRDSRKTSKQKTPNKDRDAKLMEIEGNLQVQKAKRQDLKRQKKKKRKSDALGTKLSNALEGALSGLGSDRTKNDSYDFKVDFK